MTYFRGECLRVNRLPRRFVEGVLEGGKARGKSNKVIHASTGWGHEPGIARHSIPFQEYTYVEYEVCIYLYYYEDFLRYIVFWIIGAILNEVLIYASDKEILSKEMICGRNRITWRKLFESRRYQSDVKTWRNYSGTTFRSKTPLCAMEPR